MFVFGIQFLGGFLFGYDFSFDMVKDLFCLFYMDSGLLFDIFALLITFELASTEIIDSDRLFTYKMFAYLRNCLGVGLLYKIFSGFV